VLSGIWVRNFSLVFIANIKNNMKSVPYRGSGWGGGGSGLLQSVINNNQTYFNKEYFEKQSSEMEKEDSENENDDVVFTRIKKAEKDTTRDLNTAV